MPAIIPGAGRSPYLRIPARRHSFERSVENAVGRYQEYVPGLREVVFFRSLPSLLLLRRVLDEIKVVTYLILTQLVDANPAYLRRVSKEYGINRTLVRDDQRRVVVLA